MLRTRQFAGSIAIIGDEPELPYERPPLSKEYFAGEKAFERIQIRPAKYWDEREVRMLLGQRVVTVDPAAHSVTTDGGESIGYGRLVWATGGAPRMLPVPGGDLPGVQGVRTRADADAMKAASETAGQIVVVGGGYIGLEAAAVLRKAGKTVVLLEALDRVIASVAGEKLSRFYEKEHRDHGVDLRFGVCVEPIDLRPPTLGLYVAAVIGRAASPYRVSQRDGRAPEGNPPATRIHGQGFMTVSRSMPAFGRAACRIASSRGPISVGSCEASVIGPCCQPSATAKP